MDDLGAYNRDLYRAISAMTRDLGFQCLTEGPPCLFTTYDKPGILGILFNKDSLKEMDFLIGDKISCISDLKNESMEESL